MTIGKFLRTRVGSAVIGAAAASMIAGGFAWADVPGTDGVISACLDAKGNVRVIDAEAGEACGKQETAISWNQVGPQGPKGDTGAAGANGASGAVGPMGPKGDTGAVSATGPAGPAGPAGADGPHGSAVIRNAYNSGHDYTTTWTVPAGVREITVEAWGGGGSGGDWGYGEGGGGSGGGGAGGYTRRTFGVTPGEVYTVTAGRESRANATDQTTGGRTTFVHANGAVPVFAEGGARGGKGGNCFAWANCVGAGGTGGAGGTAGPGEAIQGTGGGRGSDGSCAAGACTFGQPGARSPATVGSLGYAFGHGGRGGYDRSATSGAIGHPEHGGTGGVLITW